MPIRAVILTCKDCGESCTPEIQFIPESDFDSPFTEPFEYLSMEPVDYLNEGDPCQQ
jgi:hypothetical protein